MKSATWLYFTILSVLAHNLLSLRAYYFFTARNWNDWKLNWLALISERIHSPLLHHEETILKVLKKNSPVLTALTGQLVLLDILYALKEERRKSESKKFYKGGTNGGVKSSLISTGITCIFTLKVSFSSGSLWNGFSYFMSSFIVLKDFSFVKTATTKTVVIIETFRSTFDDCKGQTWVCTTWLSIPFTYFSLWLHRNR